MIRPLLATRVYTPPKTRFDPVKVYAFETRTGRIAATVPYVGQPRFTAGLNQAGGWSVDVPLDNPEVGKDWLSGLIDPWRFSWAIAQGSYIWQAGPVIAEDYQGGTTTTVTGGGIWKLLTDERVLINPDRATLAGVGKSDADIAFGPGSLSPIGGGIPSVRRNLSLHTIAKRIVQLTLRATDGASPATITGSLPITLPDDIAGNAVRTYPGYDLASPGQRLTELTQVINGPEIEFKPRFNDEVTKQSVFWDMRIGNPRLGNLGFPHAFDLGKSLVSLSYSVDGTGRATRSFERGNGMNRDMLVGFYDAPISSMDPAALLLEQVGNDHTSTTSRSTLNGWAQATVTNNLVARPTCTAVVRVPGDDGRGQQTRSPSLMEVGMGDNCVMRLLRHPRLPDGALGFRVVGVSSTNQAQQVELQLHYLGRST